MICPGRQWARRCICLLFLLLPGVMYLSMVSMEGTGFSRRDQWQNMQNIARAHSNKLMETLYAIPNALRGYHGGDDPLYMQYKVTQGDDHMPPELKGGAAILKARTYPKEPRKETCKRCNAYVYNTVLTPKSCEAEGDIKVLILLSTMPGARHHRNVIRKTWLSVTQNNTRSVRYMWLLGAGWPEEDMEAMKNESQEFGDILMDDFMDSYFNLTIKLMGAFRFAMVSCQRAQYVMRSADDIYVNIPSILVFLETHKNEIQEAMFGPCMGVTPVVRDKNTKYAVTRNEYAPDTYPPYCIGTAFMMSHQTMKRLFTAAENVPWFCMEDVYFGIVCKIFGIKLINYGDFNLQGPEVYNNINSTANTCIVSRTWKVIHIVSPKAMAAVWEVCPQNKTIPV